MRNYRFRCGVCGKRFTAKSHLKSHSSIHSGIFDFSCVLCESVFSTQNLLNRHLRTHTGEKPYFCKKCDKTFAENGQLTKHFRQVHLQVRPFKCTKCLFRYTTKQNLQRHIQNGCKKVAGKVKGVTSAKKTPKTKLTKPKTKTKAIHNDNDMKQTVTRRTLFAGKP